MPYSLLPARAPWITIAALFFVSAAFWAENARYSSNSLKANGDWIVSKLEMQLPVMGGERFLENRSPLAKNRLNLPEEMPLDFRAYAEHLGQAA